MGRDLQSGWIVEQYVVPQVQLPIFPTGTTQITQELAFERRDGQVVYFNGHLPVFTHEVSDLQSFRLFTTQLIVNGSASQGEIARAFGLSLTTVKRCCKKWNDGGPAAFFVPPVKRHGKRLTPDRLSEVQALLDQGESVPKIATQVGVLGTTIHKAIDAGRLTQKKKEPNQSSRSSTRARRQKANEA